MFSPIVLYVTHICLGEALTEEIKYIYPFSTHHFITTNSSLLAKYLARFIQSRKKQTISK